MRPWARTRPQGGEDNPDFLANAAVLASVARHIGSALVDDVSSVVGRTLGSQQGRKSGQARSELTINWTTKEDWGLGLRLWVGQKGAALGLRPGWVRDGWYDEAHDVVAGSGLPDFHTIAAPWSKYGEDRGFVGGCKGEFVYARWYEPEALSALDLRAEVTAVAAAVQPLIDQLVHRAGGRGAASRRRSADAARPVVPRDTQVPETRRRAAQGRQRAVRHGARSRRHRARGPSRDPPAKWG